MYYIDSIKKHNRKFYDYIIENENVFSELQLKLYADYLTEKYDRPKVKTFILVTVKFPNSEKEYDYVYEGEKPIFPGDMVKVYTNYNNSMVLEVIGVKRSELKKDIKYKTATLYCD